MGSSLAYQRVWRQYGRTIASKLKALPLPASAGVFSFGRPKNEPSDTLSSRISLEDRAMPAHQGTTKPSAPNSCASRHPFRMPRSRRAMIYEGVEYVIRASLGRDQWTLLIYFPDKAESNPTVVKFSGSRDEAAAAARRRIDNWIKRQQTRNAAR